MNAESGENTVVPQPSAYPWLLPALALALGLLANLFFYDRPLGLSAPLFVLAGLLALFGAARLRALPPAWRNAWLAGLVLALAVLTAVRADPFVTFLNVFGAVLALMLLAHAFSSLDLRRFDWGDYLIAWLLSGVEIGLARPLPELLQALRANRNSTGISPRWAALLRGLLLALPALLFFTALLSGADAVFQQYVNDFFAWLKLENLPQALARLFFTICVAWLCLGGLAYALRRSTKNDSVSPLEHTGRHLGWIEASVVLFSVNALFVAFVAVQFRYFFGGSSQIAVDGLTYAEYARRGFAELVTVAIFSLGLALLLQGLTHRANRREELTFEVLAALLAALTGVILASAFQRLLLYEQAYGFTQLRTYSHVFMFWLGALLLIFLVGLHFNRPRWFVLGCFLAAYGFVLTLNLLNVDDFIVRQNLARYTAGGELDAVYLATLSDDAVPALLAALPQLNPDQRQVLGGALHFRLNELQQTNDRAGWWGWHFGRNQAYALLEAARPQLEQYEPALYFWRFPMD
jgi:hypothetical protein